MEDIPGLVKDLALILMVAGVVTLVFKKLKQPLVLGYVVAGFLVSTHMPYTMSVVDQEDIETWANIGVMFLLFSLGLDFSFKKILKMGMQPIIATMAIVCSMVLLGITVGNIMGWSQMNCIFLGGMLAMSSTTIIYKAFSDLGLRQQRFAGMVMSVLILEDILAIVMMVMLSAIAGGNSPDGGQMLNSIVKIGFFLILWFVVGIFLIPLFLRSVRRLINNETLLIVSLGLCCGMAVLSTKVGFSSAFGAFVMGSILAETIEAENIIKLVEPVKNLFGAIFFVSVGMLVDPKILIEYAVPIIILVFTILIGQAIFGSFGFLLSGQPLKSAMQCGFSMAQIGEFSFIIASLGVSLGVTSDFLYPVVVAVSVITTFLTPYMIRASGPAYTQVEKRLPRKWIRSLNHMTLSHPSSTSGKSLWRSLLTAMLRNTLIYTILAAATVALMFSFAMPLMRNILHAENLKPYADAITGIFTIIFISPFLRSIVMKKNHSEEIHHPSRVRLRASADDNDSHSGGDTDGNVTRTEAEEHPPGAYVHTEPALTRHRGTGARPPQTAIRGTPARPRYPHRRLRDSRGVAMDGKDTYGTAPAQPLRRSCEQYSARQAAHKHPVGNNDSLSWRQPAGDRQRRTAESAERRHRGRDVQRRPRDREARDEAAASDNNGYKPVPQQDADGKRNTRQIQLYGCGT